MGGGSLVTVNYLRNNSRNYSWWIAMNQGNKHSVYCLDQKKIFLFVNDPNDRIINVEKC